MTRSSRRDLELENQRLRNLTDAARNAETKSSGGIASAILTILLTAVVTIPAGWATAVLLRQEKIGIATEWSFTQYAGTTSTEMLRVGTEFEPEEARKAGAKAFKGGVLLIALTAEQDRNYTITNVEIEEIDRELDDVQWFYVPPPSAGAGPSIDNVWLSYDFDSRAWGNVKKPEQVRQGAKFEPLNLTSNNAVTIKLSLQGEQENYYFNVSVTYQKGGSDTLEHVTVGKYAIYGSNRSTPIFTDDDSGHLVRK